MYARVNVQRVEPQSEDSCLTLSFRVKVLDLGRRFIFGERREAGMSVEKVGDEGKIELRITRTHRTGGQVFATADSIGIVQHLTI